MQQTTVELEKDIKIIPFNEVMRLADALGFDERGVPTQKRLAILWLALTGARPSEIENRKVDDFKFEYSCCIWKPRKNQKGRPRIVKLPLWFMKELNCYFEKGVHSNEDVFGIKCTSLLRYINGKIRKKLGGGWLLQKPSFSERCLYSKTYIWQLKNLRHNYATVEWFNCVEKYGHELALHKISRDMRHSSTGMTGVHYIESIDELNLSKYKHMNISQILSSLKQRDLMEFM